MVVKKLYMCWPISLSVIIGTLCHANVCMHIIVAAGTWTYKLHFSPLEKMMAPYDLPRNNGNIANRFESLTKKRLPRLSNIIVHFFDKKRIGSRRKVNPCHIVCVVVVDLNGNSSMIMIVFKL